MVLKNNTEPKKTFEASITTAMKSLAGIVLLASSALAWLPRDQDLAAFNISRYETLERRFKPTLPNGVNKIRGVNFGG